MLDQEALVAVNVDVEMQGSSGLRDAIKAVCAGANRLALLELESMLILSRKRAIDFGTWLDNGILPLYMGKIYEVGLQRWDWYGKISSHQYPVLLDYHHHFNSRTIGCG